MLDPGGIANWTVTSVDWSEKQWHPKTYMPEDVTLELLKNLTVLSPNQTVYGLINFQPLTFPLLEIIN